MQIASVTTEGRGETDRLLSDVARRLEERGLILAGVVQTNTERADLQGCDMDVRVLPGTRVIRISQSLGPEARGCRLDAGALEEAVLEVELQLVKGCDAVIVNKFGKHEAGGRGFRSVIGKALEAGVPVIVGVSETNSEAFAEFTGEGGIALAADADVLEAWVVKAIRSAEQASSDVA